MEVIRQGKCSSGGFFSLILFYFFSIFYGCHNNLPQISQFKTTHVYYFTVSVDQNFEWVELGPLLRVCHKAKIKVLSGLPSFLEALGKNPFLSSLRLLAKFSLPL